MKKYSLIVLLILIISLSLCKIDLPDLNYGNNGSSDSESNNSGNNSQNGSDNNQNGEATKLYNLLEPNFETRKIIYQHYVIHCGKIFKIGVCL